VARRTTWLAVDANSIRSRAFRPCTRMTMRSAFTGARLACSSRDGSFLDTYGVNVGKRLAFTAGGRLVITSRVCSIKIVLVRDDIGVGHPPLELAAEARAR